MSKALSVAFQTLGCKLNQGETGTIAAAFANAGFSIDGGAQDAELLVINTCAVTSKAEQKGRRLIRAALRQNPCRCVIVTGCYAELERANIEALDDSVSCTTPGKRRLFVIPSAQNSRILDIPSRLTGENPRDETALRDALERLCGRADEVPSEDSCGDLETFRFDMTGEFGDGKRRSRCFLKIQDGCDNSCAYCVVRAARGKARSLPAEEALERLAAVENAGAAEAVLTGVNICQWNGLVNGVRTGLSGLLQRLLDGTKEINIRLSSLEPGVFTEDFFETLRHPRIRPHFHLSIQSGSSETLKRMNRRYELEAALDAVRRLREVKDDPFISCDIITGFPGETEERFLETLNFCEAADFAQIHAFPFSRRRGTAAWDYRPRVPEREAEKRVQILNNLAAQNRKSYIGRWIGREVAAVCLSDAADARSRGCIELLTANYLRVRARTRSDAGSGGFAVGKGQAALCKITDFAGNGADAHGEIIAAHAESRPCASP
ncbi:MAG: radical SAM protein [Spirochaetaceae bacterium]|jgi:threonylcarbamoyladenosine tRNA methylthiotransferase MtaB|nr:radical SAM protein [Spirochaetaceae bacterium]